MIPHKNLVIASFVLAVVAAVYKDSKFWVAAIPAVIATLVTLGVASLVLFAYLVLYYFVYSPRDEARRANA